MTLPVALQVCDQFVGRTTNWLYDHLRHLSAHRPVIYCDQLLNRKEFPLLEARSKHAQRLSRRVWRRLTGSSIFPTDRQWLRRLRPQVAHAHFGYVAVANTYLHAFLDVPWLVGFYGADVYELGRDHRWLDTYADLFARVHGVLALGPEMAAALGRLGCPAHKLHVHALGVDVSAIPHQPRVLSPSERLEVLFAGTFREKKGVPYLLDGAARARQRGVRLHLTLVGDAIGKPGDLETKRAIFDQIARLELTDVVTHHSYLTFEELVRTALATHVFVAPSITAESGDAEGTPFVLQQMMATGMAVISTRHSDIPFILGPHAGQLLAERDADGIADRLQHYFENPDAITRDGMLMRRQVETTLDVRQRAAHLDAIYDAAIGRSR